MIGTVERCAVHAIDPVDAVPLRVHFCFGAVAVRGEVDLFTAPALTAALRPFVRRGRQVRIDAREITFIDAAGLRVMDDAAAALVDRGRLTLVDPSLMVQRAVELIGLRADIDVVAPPSLPSMKRQRSADLPRSTQLHQHASGAVGRS